MPTQTRGKIKEHLEGIHRNTEAIKIHCGKMLLLIGDKNQGHTQAVQALVALTNNLDELAQAIHSRT